MAQSILGIETCSEDCSVAVIYQGKTLQLLSNEPRGHADNVLPMVDQLLADFHIKLADLDAIAFTRGPGAFTGVRIGTSVAQGLSLATGLPLIAVSSLAVLAQGSYRETGLTNCLAALDARMSEVYFGIYQLNSSNIMVATQDDQVASAEGLLCGNESSLSNDINKWQAQGPGWHNYSDVMKTRFKDWSLSWPEKLFNPKASDLLTLAQWHFERGELLDPADALPIYIRDQVVRT
ncbi:MAG: tRNA (adenosine(37)-N6)-threonylcarbamoyltransferase complex dimerization subunit type 1 TsaB [Gammaproteobacteria bacterium]|nr:MAG: tRNA (adenosine(37)-N6)-threonylcarbamoyltransferase complex dimerization subunit type 1 TsaB [Gammaproteobacteria bacterium]